jgi:hypothetical protein
MRMTIRNPHDTVIVSTVRVRWNALNGAPGGQSGSPLALKSVTLGSTFWTGTDNSGDLTLTLATDITGVTVGIPGNNRTSTIVFTFDKQYKNALATTNAPWIAISLATPCDGYIIQKPTP